MARIRTPLLSVVIIRHGDATQMPAKPSPDTTMAQSSASNECAWLPRRLPRVEALTAVSMDRRSPYLSMRPPPMVARIALGMENNAMASPSCGGVVARSRLSVSMNGTITPLVIMHSTAGI